MARAPAVITTTNSASQGTVQQVAPAPAPIATQGNFAPQNISLPPQVRPIAPPQNFFAPPPPSFGPPPAPYPPFSFPSMFDTLPSSSTPTIGKAFPGTIGTSTSPSVACSEAAITGPAKTTAAAAFLDATAIDTGFESR